MDTEFEPYDSADETEVDIDLAALSYEETHVLFTRYQHEIWKMRREMHHLKQELAHAKAICESLGETIVEEEENTQVEIPEHTTPEVTSAETPAVNKCTFCSGKRYFEYNPKRYIKKMTGDKIVASPPLPHPATLIFTFIAAFIGISLLGIVHHYWLDKIGFVGVIGSMGAVATILYAATSSPLSQPRNVILGNLMSASIGMGFRFLFMSHTEYLWLAGGLSVALSIVMMQMTKSVHPPAGATCLIAIIGSDQIFQHGFWYILAPVAIDIFILLGVGFLVLNLSTKLKYPIFWM